MQLFYKPEEPPKIYLVRTEMEFYDTGEILGAYLNKEAAQAEADRLNEPHGKTAPRLL